MNYDEIKKLWEEMMDADVTKMDFSTSSSFSPPPMDDDMVDQMRKAIQADIDAHARRMYGMFYTKISPTDVDAKGKYPYQEPEVDEQGTFYGYKILKKYHRPDAGRTFLVSPRYAVAWNQLGCLTSDEPPSERTMHGIHCTKRPDHPELDNYGTYDCETILVKCALYGTVIETEQGFRAEKAKIVGVYEDEYWESYQDYEERTRTYSRKITAEKWWKTGNWDIDSNPYFDPSADS